MIIIIGLLAGILSVVALIPQIVKTYKTKSVKDLSYGWLILFLIGASLWLTYGILIVKIPVIIANICVVLGFISLLIMKILYRKNI